MNDYRYRALVIIGAVCIVLVAGYKFKPFLFDTPGTESVSPELVSAATIEQASAIGVQSRSGELDAAIAAYDSVMASSTQTIADKSSSVLLGAGLRHRLSGSTADAVAAIRDLKRVATNPDTTAFARAYAMLEMSIIHTASGPDPAVFQEIFQGEPFSTFIVQERGRTNTFASTQQLIAHSLQMYPMYRTAIALASNYAREVYSRGDSFAGRENNINSMEIHLAQAEDLARAQDDQPPPGSDRYGNYLSHRAFVIATLADVKGEPYPERYRQAYEDLFTFLRGEEAEYADARGRLAFEHAMFARALIRIENATTEAQGHLAQAVELSNSDPLKDNNALVLWIRNARESDERRRNSGLDELIPISPEFQTFVSAIE